MIFYLAMVIHAVTVEMWRPYATREECNEAGKVALAELRGHGHTQWLRSAPAVLLSISSTVSSRLSSLAMVNEGKPTIKRPTMKKGAHRYPKGLDNRMRDRDGEIRKKRSDTLIGTLREEYGPNFAKGYRANAKLGAVLKKEGLETLDQLLKKGRRSK
jgi:hypothetical protein